MKRKINMFAGLLASTAMAGFFSPAIAQSDSAANQQANIDQASASTGSDQAADGDDKAIVVTGSRIRGASAIGNVITLDRTIMEETGQVDLGEAIRQLPQNFSGGQNPGVGAGAGFLNQNVNAASAPNLRGLGPDATLTLLNGNRLPYDSAFAGIDISAIPLAAVERVEVLPDGASALYGSDAVAGVINVILRRNFEGVTTSAQIGSSTASGNFRQQVDIVAGTTWSSGGAMVAYDFTNTSAVNASQRSFSDPLEPDTTLFPASERHAAMLSAYQEITPAIELSVDALYSRRDSTLRGGVSRSFQIRTPDLESWSIIPSVEISLSSDWQAYMTGSFGRGDTRINTEFLNEGTRFRDIVGCICNDLLAVEAGAEGPLFTLPGGRARLAVGGGYRRNGFERILIQNGVTQSSFEANQEVRYVYGELSLPFFGPENGISGIEELTVSAAIRNEDFKNVEQFAAPRIGVRYAPVRSLVLHGNWSRSFKAPTLFQRFSPFQTLLFPAALFGAGAGEETVFLTSGGNPDVRAERARSITAGFEIRPETIQGLTLSGTYYDINFTDRVATPIPGSVVAAFGDPAFASLFDFDPDPSRLAELIAGSLNGLENNSGVTFDPANVVVLVDNRNTNLAAWSIEGVDVRLAWTKQLASNRSFGFDLSGTYLDSRQRVVPGLPETQLSGNVFNPPRYRARGLARYEAGPLRGNVAINYLGSLRDPRFANADRVSASATVDLGLTYDIIAGESRDPGLSVSLTVQNLFNFEPERIGGLGPTDTPFDSTNFSAIGRFVAFGIRRHW
ncbi:MAG: TonB-dependent receptor [Alphaproteobacteria bacterium HGW-Alphaproteobacteria-15]|nr:MAG: TonB-dependent receptor [Alphaproteobacteria bacterium HGW-Alphaproteobacteria-15]